MAVTGATGLQIAVILLANLCQFVAQGLQCHSCAGESDCEQTIRLFPERSGRCTLATGTGKCFIRRDPNNVVYWGCIDDVFWPGVPWRSYDGCQADWDRAWLHNGTRRPMIWCFCDFDDCNVSIRLLNETTSSPRPPTTTSRDNVITQTSGTSTSVTSASTTSSPDCPTDFEHVTGTTSCYKIVSPRGDVTSGESRDFAGARAECQSAGAHLLAVNTVDEQRRLADMLATRPAELLQGWQGWWTSGRLLSGVNVFVWTSSNEFVSPDSRLWGFLRDPVFDTCLWVMSVRYYNFTLGNYDCRTRAGYICEYDLLRV